MGAWGHQNFENDQAWDFADEFINNPTLASLEEALDAVIELGEEGEYIEADEASAALAAAEIVAAALTKPASDFPEELRPALAALRVDIALQKKACKAVKQILKESELQELWAEGDESETWQAVQANLVERLK